MASPASTTRLLRPEHHVARYCRPRTITNGIISREAFLLREGEQFLSANWLEHFHVLDRQIQVSGVRASLARKNFSVNPNGRFAVLNVGVSDQHQTISRRQIVVSIARPNQRPLAYWNFRLRTDKC